MSNSTIKKQVKALAAHMNDYTNAYSLKKKDEAAIFNKHKQPDGQFAPEMQDELIQRRKDFAKEWGSYGWRNEQFVTQHFEESRKPTDEEMADMHKQDSDDFRDGLKNKGQKPKGPTQGM